MNDQLKNQRIEFVVHGDNNSNIAIGQGITQINQVGNGPMPDNTRVPPLREPLSPSVSIGHEQRQRLFQALSSYFSDGELRDLCFELGVVYDDLAGERHRDKARELVIYAWRRNQLVELEEAVRRARPHVFTAP